MDKCAVHHLQTLVLDMFMSTRAVTRGNRARMHVKLELEAEKQKQYDINSRLVHVNARGYAGQPRAYACEIGT